MNLDHLPRAVEALYNGLLAFRPLTIVMAEVLAEFDVTEAAVRARFETAYDITPEQHAARHVTDKSIDGYIERFREANTQHHERRIRFTGERFYTISDNPKTGKEEKRWYRFLISHGLMIKVVDEITQQLGEIYDSEVIDDVARQIGWKRWSHWPDVGRQPSLMFAEKPNCR